MGRKTTKVALVNGRRMRITRLDSCGRVVFGDDNVAVSSGFVSIASKTATTATNAVEVKNANGEKLVNVPAKTSFTGFTLTIVFGEVDPELFALITGQQVVFDAFGNPIGFDINSDVALDEQAIAIEVWTGSPGTDACLDPNAKGAYGYVLFPFLQGGVLGDYSIAEGGINFTVDGISSYDGNHWGVGPYNVMVGSDGNPGLLVDPLPRNAHSRTFITGVVPPDATVGTRPQLDPSAAAVTTIVASSTALQASLTATPAVSAGTGTWWDFGDGVWDYVTTASSAVSHTYAAAGTYTVTASTNGTWISKSVTVTAS